MRAASALRVLPVGHFPEVRLIPPSASGFVLLAAQVDRRPPLLGSSARKRKVLQGCKRLCVDLRREPGVLDCTVLRAILVPPGSGGPYLKRRGNVHKARFDVVVLLEVATVQLVERILASAAYRALDRCVRDAAHDVYQTTATNVKRIGPVDHSRDGVFLLNFFVADCTDQNIAVWHQTAGWFQQENGYGQFDGPAANAGAWFSVHNHQPLPLESAARRLAGAHLQAIVSHVCPRAFRCEQHGADASAISACVNTCRDVHQGLFDALHDAA